MKSLKRIMLLVLAIAILVIIPISVYAATPTSNKTPTTTTTTTSKPVWCDEGGSKHVIPEGIGWYNTYKEAQTAALNYGTGSRHFEVQECDCGKFTAYVTINDTPTSHTHTWDKGTVTTPASCTTKGVITYHCTECDETLIGSILEKGHNYSATVVEPTCIENGYTKYVCDNCGDAYISDYVNVLDHSYRYVANNDGTHQKVCINCDFETIENCVMVTEGNNEVCVICNAKYEITNPTKPHTHTWDKGTETTSASCTTKGVITYHCGGCDEIRVENIDEIDHNYKYVPNNDGTHQKVCINCDFVIEENCLKVTEGDYEVCTSCMAKYEIDKPTVPVEPSTEPTEPTSPVEPSTEEKPTTSLKDDEKTTEPTTELTTQANKETTTSATTTEKLTTNVIDEENTITPYTGDTNRVGMYITMAALVIVFVVVMVLLDKHFKKKKNK